jgi:hypothetical protein
VTAAQDAYSRFVGEISLLLAVAGGFAVILCGLAWLAARARRRGVGGGVLGVFDEVYHPAAHRSRFEIQVQEERAAPKTGGEPLTVAGAKGVRSSPWQREPRR